VTTTLEHKLEQMIEPLLADQGLELVHLSFMGRGQGVTLQILVQNPETQTIDLDTCAKLSRTIGTHLEVEDVIKSAYRLEVSSPGIDRPLVKPAHYKRYIGFDVRVELAIPHNNQKNFAGKLVDATDDGISISLGETAFHFAYDMIAKAKLKLTDELLKAMRPKPVAAEDEETQQTVVNPKENAIK
jgi:ribosome maturation factor RimP